MEEWYESSNSVDVDDTFYDSYTGMDGWDGPEYITRGKLDWPGRVYKVETVEEVDSAIEQHKAKIAELEAKRKTLVPRTVKTTWYAHANYNHYEVLESMGLSEDDVGPDVNFKYALYEIAADVEVDLDTGEYTILEMRENGQVLVPKE